jgi:hypothetical protein
MYINSEHSCSSILLIHLLVIRREWAGELVGCWRSRRGRGGARPEGKRRGTTPPWRGGEEERSRRQVRAQPRAGHLRDLSDGDEAVRANRNGKGAGREKKETNNFLCNEWHWWAIPTTSRGCSNFRFVEYP